MRTQLLATFTTKEHLEATSESIIEAYTIVFNKIYVLRVFNVLILQSLNYFSKIFLLNLYIKSYNCGECFFKKCFFLYYLILILYVFLRSAIFSQARSLSKFSK